MDPVSHRVSAWDGLGLHVLEWEGRECQGRGAASPVLCLPGLVRTGRDFEAMVPAVAGGRRVVAVDYPGRGESGRARDPRRYAPQACARDILDLCAARHVHGAIVIGTSFGGLLAMGLAAARPGLVRAVVLNDIGPVVAGEGSDFVRGFVGFDPALDSLDACVAFLRARLPPLSLDTDQAWRRMAELTYRRGADGRFHPSWDIRIVGLLNGRAPDLWALWGGLADRPVLLVRGEVSNILLPATVARMQIDRPDMKVVALPGIGHAPTLTEPAAAEAVRAFLGSLA